MLGHNIHVRAQYVCVTASSYHLLQKRLSELDDVADDLLIKAKTFGRVYIVTNAA